MSCTANRQDYRRLRLYHHRSGRRTRHAAGGLRCGYGVSRARLQRHPRFQVENLIRPGGDDAATDIRTILEQVNRGADLTLNLELRAAYRKSTDYWRQQRHVKAPLNSGI